MSDLFEAEKLAIDFCEQYGIEQDEEEWTNTINAYVTGFRVKEKLEKSRLRNVFDLFKASHPVGSFDEVSIHLRSNLSVADSLRTLAFALDDEEIHSAGLGNRGYFHTEAGEE